MVAMVPAGADIGEAEAEGPGRSRGLPAVRVSPAYRFTQSSCLCWPPQEFTACT